ncbi:MAE_28990/MAE_18760 family HEPN-like nuclease [Acinetobacter variabilis]|uniref:MAE_28990/MAE_18760 family HEPN-like nuclease n=1 Tax=Acinetobacter variabilis TaxID=70346 RepID=UPI0028AB8249|nr:MAE_28990/MAE_18760 family HEPN-like nuclease [Acinetobacter variabilis]
MLEQSKATLREYSNESLLFIQKIKELEDKSLREGVQHVREYLNSLKGLVPVYLYGVIEKTLTVLFNEFFDTIKSYDLSYVQISSELYPFIFTNELNSFKSVSIAKSNNLSKIAKIYEKIHHDDKILDLKLDYINQNITNCWSKVLIDIYNLFSIDLEMNRLDQIAIDEIVEKRNAVAHGREKPTVAYVKTANVIIERHALVIRILDSCIQKLETYLTDKLYIKEILRQRTPQ